jgi:hypothetical protein
MAARASVCCFSTKALAPWARLLYVIVKPSLPWVCAVG